MLPPGTLKSLKGHYDGIVMVVLSAVATAAGYTVGPWFGIMILAVAGTLYHVRRCQSEAGRNAAERIRLERAVAAVDAIKARHRNLATHDQPSLPLVDPPARKAKPRRDHGERELGV